MASRAFGRFTVANDRFGDEDPTSAEGETGGVELQWKGVIHIEKVRIFVV